MSSDASRDLPDPVTWIEEQAAPNEYAVTAVSLRTIRRGWTRDAVWRHFRGGPVFWSRSWLESEFGVL